MNTFPLADFTASMFSQRSFALWRNVLYLTVRVLFKLTLAMHGISTGYADQSSYAANYELGHGLQVRDTGWTIGGYGTAALDYPHGEEPKLDLSHLALFLWWEGDSKFKLFSELDWEDSLTVQHSPINTSEYLSLERLYVDYAYDEVINLRAGKFLTPIGRWNSIHADPLVWTTSRPLVTEAVFPTNTTGAMIFGNGKILEQEIDYSIYGSFGEEIRPSPRLDPFENAFGAHITLPVLEDGQLGLSYANFEQVDGNNGRKNLYGADFIWTRNRYEFSGEIVYRYAERGHELDEKGLYLQAVVPLSSRLYGVVRFEPFLSGTSPDVRVWVAGLAMRFNPALVIKAEFVHGGSDRPYLQDGFLSSLSVLF